MNNNNLSKKINIINANIKKIIYILIVYHKNSESEVNSLFIYSNSIIITLYSKKNLGYRHFNKDNYCYFRKKICQARIISS